MYQPETYGVVLGFMIVTMLCWGSWANTVKLCPGYRFQLFYWDYVIGLALGTLLWGFSLGTFGPSGLKFFDDLRSTDSNHFLFAIGSGALFNIANLLLVAAIDIAGLAVAFPIGIGIALVVGALGSYAISPAGNPWMLFGGVALVVCAIGCDARAYGLRERGNVATSRRGVVISIVAGLLMGSFYPLISRAMSGTHGAGPYSAAFFFAIGVGLCSLPFNSLLMYKPLDGSGAVPIKDYFRADPWHHVWGAAGGLVWSTGAVFNFVASRAHLVGPAISYSIGQGATMVSAAWGVFVWREFSGASALSRRYLGWMFFLFLAGLALVALAPVF